MEIKTPSTSPDIFAEFALSEEQMTPVSPVRRQRQSDVGLPRSKTNRELTDEIAKLKDNLITSNMRVELLKKNNSELQHNLTKAKERAEELEPLEEENHDLRDENNHLHDKLQELEEEMARLRDDNEAVRKVNAELLAINEECSSHWEEQESAVQEAADTIVALEVEKSKLAEEVKKLLQRVTALEDGCSRASTLVDGSPRCPSRVYSIDESRPSTSHFDSDYYSQPDSPYVKPSTESVISITPSERSKKFLSLTEERKRSTRDLIKRMSAASLKALNIKSPSPAPEVPQIPAEYQQQVPQVVEQVVADRQSSRTPKRYRDRRLPRQPLLDALQVSPTKAGSEAPMSPSFQEGLRGLYRSEKSNETLSVSSPRSSSSAAVKPRSRQPSGAEASPRVSSRLSNKHAHSSSEHLSHLKLKQSHHRRQSESNIGTSDSNKDAEFQEWATSSMPPPPIPVPRSQAASIVSLSDLTTEADPEDKDRWWKSVERLSQSQHSYPTHGSTPVPQPSSRTPASPSLVRSKSHIIPPQSTPRSTSGGSTRPEVSGALAKLLKTPSKDRGDAESIRRARTQPSTPAATSASTASAYGDKERDFFFNGAEDEDTFMRKAKARMGRR